MYVCQVVADQIPQLVQGVRGSQSQPDSPSAQLTLIGAGQNFLLVRPSSLPCSHVFFPDSDILSQRRMPA